VGGAAVEKPEHLADLPPLETQGKIKKILLEIEAAKRAGKTIVLEASGPYSIVAALVPPALFYRFLAKEKEAITAALKAIGIGLALYLREAQERGAGVISLADPYASREILGPDRFNEFVIAPLRNVLDALNRPCRKTLVHTCPYLELSEGGKCIHSLIYANASFSYQDAR
jgi:[methyl-Co(III) methanol-specific corrinoid protein]:coenzyme M methyltransferase